MLIGSSAVRCRQYAIRSAFERLPRQRGNSTVESVVEVDASGVDSIKCAQYPSSAPMASAIA
jgi:hypothetical protein